MVLQHIRYIYDINSCRKDLKLLRQHYGVMVGTLSVLLVINHFPKLRQSRLTEHFRDCTVPVHPKKKIVDWIDKCRILRAQARKYTIIDLLKLA